MHCGWLWCSLLLWHFSGEWCCFLCKDCRSCPSTLWPLVGRAVQWWQSSEQKRRWVSVCACGNLICSIPIVLMGDDEASTVKQQKSFLWGSCIDLVQRKSCLKLLLTPDVLTAVLNTNDVCMAPPSTICHSRRVTANTHVVPRVKLGCCALWISTSCPSVWSVSFLTLCFLLPEQILTLLCNSISFVSFPCCRFGADFSPRFILQDLDSKVLGVPFSAAPPWHGSALCLLGLWAERERAVPSGRKEAAFPQGSVLAPGCLSLQLGGHCCFSHHLWGVWCSCCLGLVLPLTARVGSVYRWDLVCSRWSDS